MTSLGFVFPGQGSQAIGMLGDIAHEFPDVSNTFSEASEVLGYDLWQLTQVGPLEELNKTIHTQPALLTASYAIWKILQTHHKLKPILMAGHSLGEYTALVCANALTFSDAVNIVAARGKFMQEAVPEGVGGLAAIVGLEDSVVKQLCNQTIQSEEILAPVNFNSPGQVVVGGHLPAVERIIFSAKEAGARLAKLLPVSVPSHCILMKPAALHLQELLNTISIKIPTIPVINNVDVTIYSDIGSIRDGLVRQLFMPVRWVETIQAFSKAGISHIIECGPGKVLTGLNKRIIPDAQAMTTTDIENLKTILTF